MDPYVWRESVLSTRSLSYLSTADAATGSAGPGPGPGPGTGPGPHGSYSRTTSASLLRTNTIARTATEEENVEDDGEPEMHGIERDRELPDISELPASVAGSLLFTLPREIRDRIYGMCLTSHNGVPVEWPPLPGANTLFTLQPQLIRTCRIIYSEAAPTFYSTSNLSFHHPSDANMFVRAIASPVYSRYITMLGLHVKAQDTRLWMPYLTSADENRSLKADFPRLRDLGVRYRSTKWNHSVSPEANLRLWAEDGRLDEIIDGLRHVFLPKKMRAADDSRWRGRPAGGRVNREAFEERIARIGGQIPDGASAAEDSRSKSHVPTIKVICACRIHSAQFNMLTGAEPMPPPAPVPPPHLQQALNIPPPPPPININPANNQLNLPPLPTTPPAPVQEGEPFRGFTFLDLRSRDVTRLHDEDFGSAHVARTPFADRDGVGIALEVHCLDPSSGRRGVGNGGAVGGEGA